MPHENVKVLVVDDSAVIRALICDLVAAAPGLSVAGKAHHGREALDLIASLRPDVVTLDVQMPDMNGLAVLDAVLPRQPTPVIMVSALTRAGAAITLEALDRGAVDYVAKPGGGAGARSVFAGELIEKIRTAAGMDVRRMMARRKKRTPPAPVPAPPAKAGAESCPAEWTDKCVAVGISTGGPPALDRLLGTIRPPVPPMVIVQHMPPQFTGPLAARLNSVSALSVREAAPGDPLQPNCVLIAPGGKHLELSRRGTQVKVAIRDGDPVSGHKPSVDVMMTSAAEIFGPNCLGVIMTGMGRDGANGCRAIRAAGGYVLGQDAESSDVYGMNKVAFVEGNVDQQFSLQDAAVAITRCVRRTGRAASTVRAADDNL
jgi:two-component system chemotaxis response regulator CheB